MGTASPRGSVGKEPVSPDQCCSHAHIAVANGARSNGTPVVERTD